MANVVDLKSKLATFTEAWQPRTVALFNGHDITPAALLLETLITSSFSMSCAPSTDRKRDTATSSGMWQGMGAR